MAHDMRPAGPYGGFLSYQPRLRIPEHRLHELRDALIEHGTIEDGENGEIVLDWFCNPADGPPHHTREGIAVYFDGPDAGDPAVLFYRTGGSPQHRPPAIHIPEPGDQTRLAAAAVGLWRTLEGTVTGLATLGDYLTGVINDDTAWEPFEFTDEYDLGTTAH